MSNHKRSGKWTFEEEEYARALINAFHGGLLGIKRGTSLRKYLAEKLMCSPKRVSKKYEGSGYHGKETYLRSLVATTKDMEASQERMRLLEARFQNSIAVLDNAKKVRGEAGATNVPVASPERRCRQEDPDNAPSGLYSPRINEKKHSHSRIGCLKHVASSTETNVPLALSPNLPSSTARASATLDLQDGTANGSSLLGWLERDVQARSRLTSGSRQQFSGPSSLGEDTTNLHTNRRPGSVLVGLHGTSRTPFNTSPRTSSLGTLTNQQRHNLKGPLPFGASLLAADGLGMSFTSQKAGGANEDVAEKFAVLVRERRACDLSLSTQGTFATGSRQLAIPSLLHTDGRILSLFIPDENSKMASLRHAARGFALQDAHTGMARLATSFSDTCARGVEDAILQEALLARSVLQGLDGTGPTSRLRSTNSGRPLAPSDNGGSLSSLRDKSHLAVAEKGPGRKRPWKEESDDDHDINVMYSYKKRRY